MNEIKKKQIAILGSTGSIGTQALQVIEEHPELYEVYALTANNKVDLLIAQARKFMPEAVVIANEEKYAQLKEALSDLPVKVYAGAAALCQIVESGPIDVVLTAMVGYAGLKPTMNAIRAGKAIALANKETLVTAGHLIIPLAREKGIRILPVDSEHSAIFQAIHGEDKREIHKLLITASGGPFRGKKREDMEHVKVEDALKHPNWAMGQKITIDSATLVNKGLEVMEAKWLFDVDLDHIQVVVQPKSIIHSMVEFVDGAVMAQLGTPDMKLPIQYALYYPHRRYLPGERLDFKTLTEITFEEPDMETFLGLPMAMEASRRGGSMPTVFNAANERAVAKFLHGQIGFLDIYRSIREAMDRHQVIEHPGLEEILETEAKTYEWMESRWSV